MPALNVLVHSIVRLMVVIVMKLLKSDKHSRTFESTLSLVIAALFLFFQSPVFSAQMWDELLEEQLEEANNGDAEAQYGVGIKYLKGQGVKRDKKEAVRWLKKAAASGHEGANDKLLRLQSQKKEFERVLNKAEAGDLKAQYQAGIMYLKGKGVEMNGGKARSWIGKAAEQGERKAITRMGILYYKGEGGAKDYARALKQFNAVSNDSVLAQYYLGEIYASGKGVDKNYTTAVAWYKKAADGGYNRAGGKIINMEEEIKMEKRRNINAARKTELEKVARIQKLESKQLAVARQAEARQLAAARKKAKQQKKKVPVATKKAVRLTPLEKLAGKQWTRKQKQVEYLPSKVTDCEMEKGKLICFSGLLTRNSGSNTVHYRVKAEVTSARGVFNVTYRNLVIDAVNIESDDEELLGYDEEAGQDQGFHIQTGWTQGHKVECRPNANGGLNCIKDQTHKMVFAGK